MNSTMQEMRTTVPDDPLRRPGREPIDGPPGAPSRVATIDSTALIGSARLVHIRHRGELYSLRQTRLGKLILTK